MSTITWLHLSDLHFQEGDQFNRQVVLSALLADIGQLVSEGLRPDFVVFTGDVAYHGWEVEYRLAVKHFFDPLLQVTRLPKERLFIVPGNHDVNWRVLDTLSPRPVRSLTSRDRINDLLNDEIKRNAALRALGNYVDFARAYLRADDRLGNPSDWLAYWHVRTLEVDGKQIKLVGLNSAWASGYHRHLRVEDPDYGQLLIGERQVAEALAEAEDADLCIAAMHHPFDYLRRCDRVDVESRLRGTCHFILRGHEHTPQVMQQTTLHGQTIVIPAGAAYDRREYANGYNFVRIDLQSGDGTVYLRHYVDTLRQWQRDTYHTGDELQGRLVFSLPRSLMPMAILEALPKISGFVGREEEVASYLAQLGHDGLVVLGGPPRVGKTWLGVRIATQYQRESRKVFYHRFLVGSNDNFWALVQGLAEFLSRNGHGRAKAFIAHLMDSAPEMVNARIRDAQLVVLEELAQDDFLLCLDNLHRVDDVPSIGSFLTELGRRVEETSRPKMIGMSRTRPRFADELALDFVPVEGFTREGVGLFLSEQSIYLQDDLVTELFELTGGSPGFLHDLLPSIRHAFEEEDAGAMRELFRRIRQTDRRQYVQWFFDRDIGTQERGLLTALSVPRKPVDHAAVGALLADEGFQGMNQVVETLVREYIISESELGELWLHDVLQEFYANKLERDLRMKQRLNRNLARYYEQQQDYLEAAYHYSEVDEVEGHNKSAQLLCDNLSVLIRSGQGKATLNQLERFAPQHLCRRMWLRTQEAQGDLSVLLGHYPRAIELYEAVLKETQEGEIILAPRQKADLRRKLGKVYERQGKTRDALREYGSGLKELTEDDKSIERTRLLKDKAWSLTRSGEDESALKLCQEALELVEPSWDQIVLGELYHVFADIYLRRDDLQKAERYVEQSLDVFSQAGDDYNLAKAFDFQGRVRRARGDSAGALQAYEEALRLHERLGHKRGIAGAHNNIARVYSEEQSCDRTEEHLEKALGLFRELGDSYGTELALLNLAETRFMKKDLCSALSNCWEAFEIQALIEDEIGMADVLKLLDKMHKVCDPAMMCNGELARADMAKLREKVQNELNSLQSEARILVEPNHLGG